MSAFDPRRAENTAIPHSAPTSLDGAQDADAQPIPALKPADLTQPREPKEFFPAHLSSEAPQNGK